MFRRELKVNAITKRVKKGITKTTSIKLFNIKFIRAQDAEEPSSTH